MRKPIKICKNPDCQDEIVEYKSSKRMYCSDYCRNHHGHKRRSQENLEFTNYKNSLCKNYNVLKLHRDNDILFETLIKYEKFGFNTKFLPEIKFYNIGGQKTQCYQIKDIVFGLDQVKNRIIIYKENK